MKRTLSILMALLLLWSLALPAAAAETAATLRLELTATAGKLFFNVTAPVDKDESLNIRTSTMVTGVRGTSGWVDVVDRFTSRVHLLEGTLTVTSSEPATGQMRQATITGGQTAKMLVSFMGAMGI